MKGNMFKSRLSSIIGITIYLFLILHSCALGEKKFDYKRKTSFDSSRHLFCKTTSNLNCLILMIDYKIK